MGMGEETARFKVSHKAVVKDKVQERKRPANIVCLCYNL